MRIAIALTLLLLVGCGRTEPLRAFEDGGEPLDDAGTARDAGPPVVVGCVTGHIALNKATPAVMFVLDRSGSMNTTLGNNTRWQGLTYALMASLPSIASEMEIGGLFYPAPGSNRSCSVENATTLPLAFDNVSSLLAQMLLITPGGQTPTADAVARAGTLISGVRAASSARALVLATDGAPNCNGSLDPNNCKCANNTGGGCRGAQMCLDDARTVRQLSSLFETGLPTYVIGIQDADEPVFVATLNAMAKAGGRPRTGKTQAYYAATSEAEIETALVTIRDQVGSCVYLTTSVPDSKGAIEVTVNGALIPASDGGVDGWSWGNQANGEIVITGGPCETTSKLVDPLVEAQVVCAKADAGQ